MRSRKGRFANRPYINVSILWHVPTLVSEYFETQLYCFADIPEGFFHRLALRVAAGQCRNFNPVPAFFGCMNYD